MKTLPVFVAALALNALAFGALPLGALAQPAPDGGPAPANPGLTPPPSTEVAGLTVTARCPPLPDSDWPSTTFDAPANTRGERTQPSPGTREFLDKEIALIERDGAHDYAQMDAGVAKVTREQSRALILLVRCPGAFKSIRFLHVSAAGFDDYEVEFANGALEWEVAPLDARQRVSEFAIRDFYPQPVTRRFRDLLESMARDRPDYAALAPGLASSLQAQWPALQKALKDWGSLGSLAFVRQADDGSYVYVAGFGRRGVVWRVGPLDADGKLTGLTYEEQAG